MRGKSFVVVNFQSVHGESAGRSICMIDIDSELYVMIYRTKYLEDRPNELSKLNIIPVFHSFK